MKGKLVKLTDNKFKGKHPNGINEGHIAEGIFTEFPKVGESFMLFYEKLRAYRYFHTSTVTKIVNESDKEILFKTLNSTYNLEFTKK